MEVPHEDEIKSYFVVVMKLITEFSFGSRVYADPTLVQALTRSLPLIYFEILRRQYHDINIKIVVNVVRGLIDEDISLLKKEDEKRLAFEVAFIMMFNFIHKNLLAIDMYDDVEALLEQYSDFKGNTDMELTKLLAFANVMKVALHTVPAKNHKNHLLDVVTRITEGREIKYVTGSGQTAATARRVQIYEQEGKIKPLPRPPRKANPNGSTQNPTIGAAITTGSGPKRKIEVGAFNTLYEDLYSSKRMVNDEGFPVRSSSIQYNKTADTMQAYISSSSHSDLHTNGYSNNHSNNTLLNPSEQLQSRQFVPQQEYNHDNNSSNNIYSSHQPLLLQQQQSLFTPIEIHQQQPFALLETTQQQQQQQQQQIGYYNLQDSNHSNGSTSTHGNGNFSSSSNSNISNSSNYNDSSNSGSSGYSSSSSNNGYSILQPNLLPSTIVDTMTGVPSSSSSSSSSAVLGSLAIDTTMTTSATATTATVTNIDSTQYVSSNESVAGFSVQSHLDLFDDLIWDNDYQI